MELLIALTIVAILTTIAFPSFMQSVRKSKRIDAQTALTNATNNLERFFATNGTYTVDSSQLGLKMDAGSAYSENDHYVVVVAAGATGIGSSYVVTATATADGVQAGDTGCTVLSLDSRGRRIPDPTASRCW